MRHTGLLKRLGLVLLLAVLGCGEAGDGAASPSPEAPGGQPVIEEPDLFKVLNNHLYLQNPTTGFNILDVSQPSKPRLLGRATNSSGAGGEMYVRDTAALVLIKNNTGMCQYLSSLDPMGWSSASELLIVDTTDRGHPTVIDRLCLPGALITSRTVDDMLYVVQASPTEAGSRAISLDISNPHQVQVKQQLELDATSKEIKVTADRIFVAGQEQVSPTPRTKLSLVQIDPNGEMIRRGDISLEGAPRGRFHMDLHHNQFRIVTYDDQRRETWLHVVDLSDPTNLRLMGQLSNIGQWEQLYATRFDGDMAYVVTFRQTDPLWVISLKDPRSPHIVGQLQVPGYSDFIFPRGETLLTVGRGPGGGSLGVSLFDISDSANPRTVHQITLGDPEARSEANVDHRAVTIIERQGKTPLLVIPHTAVSWQDCKLVERLQLVELASTQLVPRGFVEQLGTIRRSLWHAPALYSISDHEVLALELQNLEAPAVSARVTVGSGTPTNPDAAQYCSDWSSWDNTHSGEQDGSFMMFRCAMQPSPGFPPVAFVLGLLWLGVWFVRRSR